MQASPLCSVKWRAAHNKWAIILPNTIPDTPIIGVTSHFNVSRSNPKNSPLWHIVVALIEIRLHLSTIACPRHTCLGAAKWRSYFVFPLRLIWPGPCSIFHGDAKDYWKWGCCTDALISHWVYYNLCVWSEIMGDSVGTIHHTLNPVIACFAFSFRWQASRTNCFCLFNVQRFWNFNFNAKLDPHRMVFTGQYNITNLCSINASVWVLVITKHRTNDVSSGEMGR